jgi:peptidoglycan hydrolase-like protein with peptidoglycan-binding domain
MHGSDLSRPQDPAVSCNPLKPDEEGEEVQELQYLLIRIGYHDTDGDLLADGYFGDPTRRAVEAFQYDYGLVVDGWVGTKTMAALKHAEGALRVFSAPAHRPTGSADGDDY